MLIATEWLQSIMQGEGIPPGNHGNSVNGAEKEPQQHDWSELLTMRGLESEWLPVPPCKDAIIALIKSIDGTNCILDCGAAGQKNSVLPEAYGVVAGSMVVCNSAGEIITSGVESGWLEFSQEDVSGVGQNLLSWLGLDKRRLEVSPTPDRGDCLSVIGIARELAPSLGYSKLAVRQYTSISGKLNNTDTARVVIRPGTATARYCGRFIRGIDITAPSPRWLKNRLLAAGINSSYCVVDVTNYVMLELGQPMHAFDASEISGNIIIRWAKSGEELELLNGSNISLQKDCLLVADSKGPLALAGIMGGMASAVNQRSCDIFLESALFLPQAISGKAMRYNLHTDSSSRFEHRVDHTVQKNALEYATMLIQQIAGGTAGPVCEVNKNRLLPKQKKIRMSAKRLERVTGENMSPGMITEHLEQLELKPAKRGHNYTITPPPYRYDLTNDDDIVAEVLRLYGYDKIQPKLPEASVKVAEIDIIQIVTNILSNSLVGRGYTEVLHSSFRSVEGGNLPEKKPEALIANFMSEKQGAMRTSLWPGLLQCLEYNTNRGQHVMRIFEAGTVFMNTGEQTIIAGLASGFLYKDQWNNEEKLIDFYDVKMDLQSILSNWHAGLDFVAPENNDPAMHPGRCAKLQMDGKAIGVLGELHPRFAAVAAHCKTPVYLFHLELDKMAVPGVRACEPVSRYPSMRRDLSMSVPVKLSAGSITNYIKSIFSDKSITADDQLMLEEIIVFDVFYGDNVLLDSKSIAIGLIFRKKGDTLTDQEADAATDAVAAAAADKFGAVRR